MKVTELDKVGFNKKVAYYHSYPDGRVLKSDKPCVVDFYAPWCVYCKSLAPILEELAEQYSGRVEFYKVDVDKEPELESAFNIRTIPNLLFCPVGGVPFMKLGTMPKAQLKALIEESFGL